MQLLRYFLSVVLSFAALSATAQNLRDEFAADPDKAGGVYYVYTIDTPAVTPAPRGYRPFYISHYGRHGSRWLLHDSEYEEVMQALDTAAAAGALSVRGLEVRERVRRIYDDGIDRAGDLTQLGALQHRGIAERMYSSYPEVFAEDAVIEAQATTVVRCVMSMAAFCERLKELNPALQVRRTAGNRTTRYLNFFCKLPGNPVSSEYLDFIAEGPWRRDLACYAEERVSPERLLGELFCNGAYARGIDGRKLMKGLFGLARGMQNVGMDVSLYDLFTQDEIYWLSVFDNYEYYVIRGPSTLNEGYPQHYAKALLRDVLDRADRALASAEPAADLRFGHDGNIMAFVPLLRLEGWDGVYDDPEQIAEKWPVYRLSPMAANIQFVFYRSGRNDEVLVKILHNEQETRIPIPAVSGPYYRWSDVRRFYHRILDE